MSEKSTISPAHAEEVREISFALLSVASRSTSIDIALDALLSAYVTAADRADYLENVPKAFASVLVFIRAELSERSASSQSHTTH